MWKQFTLKEEKGTINRVKENDFCCKELVKMAVPSA